MYSCIIFDVDGTLIDTDHAAFSSYDRVVYEEFGRHFEPEELRRAYTVPTRQALIRLGVKDVEKAEEKYHRYLMKAFCAVKPFEGIPAVLEKLQSKKVPIGVVTSRNRREVEQDPCFQSLIRYFPHVVCADDTEKHKPEPEPLLKILGEAGAELSTSIYIGDTLNDYRCAKGAGIHFGLALWGARSLAGIHAEYNLERPEEILKLVRGLDY